jgi:hypothetical protein
MKKLLKRKLFYTNGSSKNYFLWEIANDRGVMYEIIEEFKGHSIARAQLKGIYNNRLKAMAEFKRVVSTESAAPHITIPSSLVFG